MGLPFLCLFIGYILADKLKRWSDKMIRWGLFALLIAMGINIGSDQSIFNSIPLIGMQAVLYCVMASLGSIILTVIWERLFLPDSAPGYKIGKFSNMKKEWVFVAIVIVCMLTGILWGRYAGGLTEKFVTFMINLILIIIYVGVGASTKAAMGKVIQQKRSALVYMAVPFLVTGGSLIGGVAAGLITGEPWPNAAAIGGGMAYYSLSAAVITDQAGVSIGFLAFLTNLLRELLTLLLTPFLARYSYMTPIALGGASTMDTTLAAMKQNLSEKYTILAFFNGVALTFIVPLLLLIIYSLA